MIKKLGAKNKGMTKDGSRPRWGILVDGQWWNTINPHHGEVIDGLKKGDEIEVTLVERGNFKNIDAIEPVVDVNEEIPEWDDGEPMPEPPPEPKKTTKWTGKKVDDNRDWSFCAAYTKDVAIAMATITGSTEPLLPDNMIPLYDFFMSLKKRG